MMLNVSGHDVSKRSNGDLYVIRRADPRPVVVRQIVKEDHVGSSKQREFLEQIRKAAFVRMRVLDISVLFETLDRRLIAARYSKQAIGEHSFTIDQMPEKLFDTPLALGVCKAALLLGHRRDQVL